MASPAFRQIKLASVSLVALGAFVANAGAAQGASSDAGHRALTEIHISSKPIDPAIATASLNAAMRRIHAYGADAIGAISAPGLSSGQSGSTTAAPTVNEITITGSRIRNTGFTAPTPVTVVTAAQLKSIAPGEMIDALNQIPEFIGNDSPSTAGSKAASAGASNVNLRGLGAKRTLVLLNGERVVPSNRLGNVDINLFPSDLIQRVETVTGGASAAYGTDAVAGVVNFILDTKFTGIKGRVQGGITQRADHSNYGFGLTVGTDLGQKFHLIASVDGYAASRVDNLDGRYWYKGGGLVQNPAWPGSTPQYLIERSNVNSTLYTNGGLINAPGTPINRLQFMSDGSAVPFAYGSIVGRGTQNEVGGTGYNTYGDYNTSIHTKAYPQGTRSGSFIPKTRRRSAFLRLDGNLSDNFKAYVQGLWGYNFASTPGTLPKAFGNWAYTIFQGNAFLPPAIESLMEANNIASFKLERYNTAADIAQDRLLTTNNTYSLSAGFTADITGGLLNGWQTTGYYQVGWNRNHELLSGFLRVDRLMLALDAVRDPATGSITCRVNMVNPGGPYSDCVPLDVFGVGRASQEAINWVTDTPMVDEGNTREDNAEVTANGDISEGWGAGAISLAVGASWRHQRIHQILSSPAPVINQTPLENNAATGFRGLPPGYLGVNDYIDAVNLDNFHGGFSVEELFAETLVPLVANKPFLQQVNLDLAARWANYTGSGGIWAWKVGLDWQINSQVRLRANRSRDVRAASLAERFDSQGYPATITDHNLSDLNYTTFQIEGGNPNVNPEKADTTTLGVVYQPAYISGLSMSVDWFDVKVKGAIDLFGPQQIVDACYASPSSSMCSRIARDPSTGRISLIQNTYINLGGVHAQGLDLEASYNTAVKLFGGGPETISARFLANWMFKNSVTDTDGNTIDYNGEVGAGSYPSFRLTANVTYGNGPFSLNVQERYVGSGINDVTYVQGVNIADNSVKGVFYTDMRAEYTLGEQENWKIFLSVTNLLDQDPPFIPSRSIFGSLNTNEYLYDVLGRRFVTGVSFNY